MLINTLIQVCEMEIHLYELQLILSFWEEKFFESIVQMKFLLKNILWMNCLIE